jgi:hypothetical protein
MKAISKRLPTPAMLVACVALVVSLGGVSYAAGVLPKNSVGTAQLQKKAVTGAKVKNRTLTAVDFKAGQLPAGPQGPAGPEGPRGDTGAAGQPGPAGATGISGYEVVNTAPATLGPGAITAVSASCPAGKKVLGGGGTVGHDVRILASRPVGETAWWWQAQNEGASTVTGMQGYAICANVD